MRRSVLLALLSTTPLVASCIQPLDGGLASSGSSVSGTASPSGPPLDPNTGLPVGFEPDADVTQQCEPNSALCYELCGSPSCANQDNSIPSELASPPVLLADGGMTEDPCVQINAESLAIRTRACAQCHSPAAMPPQLGIDYILDDQKLLTSVVAGLPMIVAGNPAGSLVYARMSEGIAGDTTGMPIGPNSAANYCGDLASTIVYPTPQDMSIMYAWIEGCVGSDGGNAYAPSFTYGPGYAPADSGVTTATPVAADSGDAASSGSVTTVVDSGTVVPPPPPPVDSGEAEDSGGGTVVVASNLITNGDFTQGTADWSTGGVGTLAVNGGQLCVTVAANTPVTLGWTPGTPLVANQSYTFSYGVRSTGQMVRGGGGNVTIDAKIAHSVTPFTPVDFESPNDMATTTLTTITHPFTLGAIGDTSAGVAFTFTSAAAATLCFANVTLQ